MKTTSTSWLRLFVFLGSIPLWGLGVSTGAFSQALAPVLPPPASTTSGAQPSTTDIQLMPRQMMVIREGLDAVYGQIMFVVRNNAAVPLPFKFRVLMPKETSDFSPREGLEPGDVVLADAPSSQEGFRGLVVEKVFPPGVHMMTIGYKVDGSFGSATLTLSHPEGVQDLNLLSLKEGRVSLESSGLVKNSKPEEADPLYDALQLKSPLEPGQVLTIQVTGIPEGRTRLWWMGGLLGGILLASASILTLRTRPQRTGGLANT